MFGAGSRLILHTRCPGCLGRTRVSPSRVTVTPTYVVWFCPVCQVQVWRLERSGNVRQALVECGASWDMDDPLTSEDVTAFHLDLASHDDLIGVLEQEAS